MLGCHNEGGLRSGNKLRECLIEFIHSRYNVLLLQEHKLNKKKAEQAERFCAARGIAARFTVRRDEAAREGTAVLVKLHALALKSTDVTFKACADGRCTTASFVSKGHREKVASVYLPTRPNERGSTIKQIRDSKILERTTMIGGDHNCVPNLMLDAHAEYENSHAREWEAYLTSLGLKDVTRSQEGQVKGPYTRMPHNECYTRIDRILAIYSADVQHSAGVDEAFGFSASRTRPDHKAIYVTRLYLTKEARGKDVTRINISLLQEPNIRAHIRDMHTRVYKEHKTEAWGHAAVWSLFKHKVVSFLLKQSRNRNTKASQEVELTTTLLKRWTARATKQGSSNYQERVRDVLRQQLIKAKDNCKPRSKQAAYRRLLYEERATKETFSSLKAPKETQWIESLKMIPDWDSPPNEGTQEYNAIPTSQDMKEATKCATGYYSWLFGEKPSDPHAAKHFTDLLEKKTLSATAASGLEGDISVKETYKSMCTLANGKAAGPDALPNEFYKWFAGLLAGPLSEVYNEAFQNNTLPECMRKGSISVLYKKKDRQDMRNYRPITLLNCDYKVLTRILCWRMKRVMHEIVSPENTGFAPGRFIGENSILTKLIQAYLDEEQLPGALVFVDFEKAFDRVSWEFMHKALKALGFGPDFRSKMHTLYDNAHPQMRRVVINGHAGKYFPLGSGVAQGCPLSPLLYLCVAESITRAINANPNIKGIVVGDTEIKLSQFADDTLNLIADTEGSWQETKAEYKLYELASGQRLNIMKTEAVLGGTLRHSNPFIPMEWKVCQEGDYIISLGVPIGNDFNEEEFWNSKYFKCKGILANWKHLFTHSVKGRVLISQASVYSRFRYWLNSMMPSTRVDEFIHQDVKHLLWAGHPEFDPKEPGSQGPCAPPFLKKEAAQLKWGQGGIGVLNWRQHSRAFRAQWMVKYLDPTRGVWKILLDHWVLKHHPTGRHGMLSKQIKGRDIFPNHQLLNFFADALDTFHELEWVPQPQPKSKENALSMPLWNNPYLNMYMFDDTTKQALQELDFFTLADLWDDDARSPWSPDEVHTGFAGAAGANAALLQRQLGNADKFRDEWNIMLNEIPNSWWKLLKQPEHVTKEGCHFAFRDQGRLRYALYVDEELNAMIPCEITTAGSLHELEEIEEIPENTFGMKILYDDKSRVMGAEELTYPRWHEWKLKKQDGNVKAGSVKIKHIYWTLLEQESSSPNCEHNWDEQGLAPPPRGWGEVWKQFHGLMGTPRDYKTRFKFLQRGLWTQHKMALVALKKHTLISDTCIWCQCHQGTHMHFVACSALDRSYDWFANFGDMLNSSLQMSIEDKVYGTCNNGEKMPSVHEWRAPVLFGAFQMVVV